MEYTWIATTTALATRQPATAHVAQTGFARPIQDHLALVPTLGFPGSEALLAMFSFALGIASIRPLRFGSVVRAMEHARMRGCALASSFIMAQDVKAHTMWHLATNSQAELIWIQSHHVNIWTTVSCFLDQESLPAGIYSQKRRPI